MGKKKQWVNKPKGFVKTLPGILSLILLALLVIAATPSVPTTFSPTNQSLFGRTSVNLSCSGSGAINYSFLGDNIELVNSLQTTYEWTSLGYTTHNWTCRACDLTQATLNDLPARGALLAYYSFDNSNYSAPTVYDLTLQGRDAENLNAVTGHTGINNESFRFSNANSLVNVTGTDSHLRLPNGGTVNMWVNWTGADNGARLFTINSSIGVSPTVDVYFDTTGNFITVQQNGGEAIRTINNINGSGNFNMVTVIIKKTPGIGSIFINDTNVTSTGSAQTISASNRTFTIGNRIARDRNFEGMIDELSVFNVTLNSANISLLWSSGTGKFHNNFFQDCSAYANNRTLTVFNITQNDAGNLGLRLIFKNESNNQNINGSIINVDLDLDTSDNDAQSYSFTNSTSKENWTFAVNPQQVQIPTNGTISYSGTGFIQRQNVFDKTINGSGIINQTLFLLPTTDGIYVTFQVVDVGNNVQEGASVSASIVVGGALTEVSSGITDASGAVTFWLNPNTQHTISASKTGVGSTSFSLTPTQSSYTITLGGSELVAQNSTFLGISYLTLPSNIILSNSTLYNFSLDINSSYWNMTSWGFTLYNDTSHIVSMTNNSLAGGKIWYEYNTGNNTEINMDYWWLINGNYTNLSRSWNVRSTYTGGGSLKNFLNDFKAFAAVGFNAGYNTFGGIIISIVILVLVVGGLSYSFGIYSPIGIMSMIFVTTLLLEASEIMPPLIRQYLLSGILAIILIAYMIQENSR